MTTYDLLTNLRCQGLSLRPLPGGMLEVRPKSKLTDTLREVIRQHKTEIIAVLTRPPDHIPLWQTHSSLPLLSPPSSDTDYWTQRCNAVLDQWRRKDWGPCRLCNQTAWYENMGFSLCEICTQRTSTAEQYSEEMTTGKTS